MFVTGTISRGSVFLGFTASTGKICFRNEFPATAGTPLYMGFRQRGERV